MAGLNHPIGHWGVGAVLSHRYLPGPGVIRADSVGLERKSLIKEMVELWALN